MSKDTFLVRKVRRTYRKHMLAQICVLPEEAFARAFSMHTVPVAAQRAPADYYHFRDNGSTVLAVAHLDTVVARNERVPHFYDTPRGPAIRSGALDDRLGAYVILGILPKLGINVDVLLTVGEEQAESTARHFLPSKQYDWVIEFDRAGTDVVMYQFEDDDSRAKVEAAGAPMDWGSYSDIAYLEHLGVKAFNWGVGYGGNYHSRHGYAYLNDTFAMVAKYARFHKQNAGTYMAHDPATAEYSRYGDMWEKNTAGKWFRVEECVACFARDSISSAGYCRECDTCQDCGSELAHCLCYAPPGGYADPESESPDDTIAGALAAFQNGGRS